MNATCTQSFIFFELKEVKNSVKLQVLDRIEESRRKLGQDVILRTATGDMVTEHNTPIVELFQMVQRLSFSLLLLLLLCEYELIVNCEL